MSVIVKGMRMPDTCEECQVSCEVGSDLHCQVTDDGNKWGWKKSENGFESRPDWCPLVELPEKHGPMIDCQALLEEARRLSGPLTGDGWSNQGMFSLIARQPTIVEAEGE